MPAGRCCRPRRRTRSVTSTLWSTSTTRCREPAGRNTAKRLPLSATSSMWTPDRPAPSDPTSSLTSPSRSICPTPATTVRRGWRSRVKVFSPASMTTRSNRTRSDRRAGPSDLSFLGRSPMRDVREACATGARPPKRGLESLRAAARVAVRSRRLCRVSSAPLAQSAERFHGKEKVVSSILSGGSPAGPCRSLRRGSGSQPGGVAQSVRALGS